MAAVGTSSCREAPAHRFRADLRKRAEPPPRQPGLEFPRTDTPGLADYLYFAFTVGTSFATSGTSVTTVRMRWLVLLHSVVSFFYNALVVAVAIQIIQQIAGA
ncbi:MAG: DUF1345 domain-containing protein [Candidatus Nanopelagicales bacterium]